MKRDNFGSSFGVLMAVIGSAVGLGNLWKFPYVVGNNGGAAFILLYLGFMLLLCLPLMLCEFLIGRRAQANTVGAFKKLTKNKFWGLIGLTGVAATYLILSFYSVVGGWTLEYIVASLGFGHDSIGTAIDSKEQFTSFIQSPVRPLLFHFIFLGLTMFVVLSGVKSGIEKYSKILMPVLFVMVIILAIRSVTLPGAGQGIEFLLKPDLSLINADVIINALGQGLFSLSLGMGILITYGSYIGKSENLTKLAFVTISADILFALIAGLAILPAVFALGYQPDEGPGLVFITLPEVFKQIPGGPILSVLFFMVLSVAALTSAISLLEVIVAYLSEELKISRKVATWVAGSTIGVLGIFCSLSLGAWSEFKIFGNNIFDLFDKTSSNLLMPLGGLLTVLFVGWVMKRSDVYDELSNGGSLKLKMMGVLMFLIKFFAPVAIVIIFLNKIGLI